MKGSKIARALASRRAVFNSRQRALNESEGEFTMPGSENPNKGYAAAPGRHRKIRVAPQGGGNPTRRARRTGIKSGPNGDRIRSIRGQTRGAANKARRAIRMNAHVNEG